MGWPTDIKFTPRLYKEIFRDNPKLRKILQEWAIENLGKGNVKKIEYNLGDLVWFILEEGPHFKKEVVIKDKNGNDIGVAEYPAPINITTAEAHEWLDILEEHFERRQNHKRRVEDVIETALQDDKFIKLEVTDDSRWRRPRTTEPGKEPDPGKRKYEIEIRSPRRPHRERRKHQI